MPELVRWPGKIPAGSVSNEIISHTDWLPTLLAAAGEPAIIDKLKKGTNAMFIIFDTPEAGIGIPVSLQGFGDALAGLK